MSPDSCTDHPGSAGSPRWEADRSRFPRIRELLLISVVPAIVCAGSGVVERLFSDPAPSGLEVSWLSTRVYLLSTVSCAIVYLLMHRRGKVAGARGDTTPGANDLLFPYRDETRDVGASQPRSATLEPASAVSQLAAGFANEVGNPLSSISSIVQMLRRAGTDRKTGEQLTLIETHIGRISSSVQRLSRLAHRDSMTRRCVDVGASLDRAMRTIASEARNKNVEVILQGSADLPCIRGVPAQLDQAFVNLALSSLDAMPEGGTLIVTRGVTPSGICIELTGPGREAAPDAGSKTLDPHFEVRRPVGGSRPGLAASHGIIRRIGGTIDQESIPGRGMAFSVYIPTLGREWVPELRRT